MPCMSKQNKITFTWFKKGSSLKHNNELILSIYVNNELILSRKVFAEFFCLPPAYTWPTHVNQADQTVRSLRA